MIMKQNCIIVSNSRRLMQIRCNLAMQFANYSADSRRRDRLVTFRSEFLIRRVTPSPRHSFTRVARSVRKTCVRNMRAVAESKIHYQSARGPWSVNISLTILIRWRIRRRCDFDHILWLLRKHSWNVAKLNGRENSATLKDLCAFPTTVKPGNATWPSNWPSSAPWPPSAGPPPSTTTTWRRSTSSARGAWWTRGRSTCPPSTSSTVAAPSSASGPPSSLESSSSVTSIFSFIFSFFYPDRYLFAGSVMSLFVCFMQDCAGRYLATNFDFNDNYREILVMSLFLHS